MKGLSLKKIKKIVVFGIAHEVQGAEVVDCIEHQCGWMTSSEHVCLSLMHGSVKFYVS